jgi:ribosomal protein L7/L12
MVEDAQFAKLNARVTQLERQVEFLLKQLSVKYIDQPVAVPYPEVAELKRKGQLLEAIKVYRSYTNASLLEAKNFVESLEV